MTVSEFNNILIKRLLEKLIERLDGGEKIDSPSYAIAALDAWNIIADIFDEPETEAE